MPSASGLIKRNNNKNKQSATAGEEQETANSARKSLRNISPTGCTIKFNCKIQMFEFNSRHLEINWFWAWISSSLMIIAVFYIYIEARLLEVVGRFVRCASLQSFAGSSSSSFFHSSPRTIKDKNARHNSAASSVGDFPLVCTAASFLRARLRKKSIWLVVRCDQAKNSKHCICVRRKNGEREWKRRVITDLHLYRFGFLGAISSESFSAFVFLHGGHKHPLIRARWGQEFHRRFVFHA